MVQPRDGARRALAMLLVGCGGPLPNAVSPPEVATSTMSPTVACPYGMALRTNGCWTRSDASNDGPIPEEYKGGVYPPGIGVEQRRAWVELFNAFHVRVHSAFADHYLSSLEGLPAEAPVNQGVVVTRVDITLAADGGLMNVAVQHQSGVDTFDREVLSTITRSGPYPAPPKSLVEDGRVQFRYAFTRPMRISCSSVNASPLLGP